MWFFSRAQFDAIDKYAEEEEDDDAHKKSTVKAIPISDTSEKMTVDFVKLCFPADNITIEDPRNTMRNSWSKESKF